MLKSLIPSLFYIIFLITSNSFCETLIVAAERTSISSGGGLGHVIKELPKHLEADLAMPMYSTIPDEIKNKSTFVKDIKFKIGNPFKGMERDINFEVYLYKDPDGTNIYFFKNDHYFYNSDRAEGHNFKSPYTNHHNEGEAFGAFNKAVSYFIASSKKYKNVLLSDWHTGLVPYFLTFPEHKNNKNLNNLVVLFSIHNLAYAGNNDPSIIDNLGLDPKDFNVDGYEFYGNVSFMKAGIFYSDAVSTVSPVYAYEITTPEFGAGFDGLLKTKRKAFKLFGITNGIDIDKWSPKSHSNKLLKYKFDDNNLRGKVKGKRLLQQKFNLPIRKDTPLIISTSRITHQKGWDHLLPALENILENHDVQIIITGDSDTQRYSDKLNELVRRYPQKIVYNKFSPATEAIVTAYGDYFINASLYEPCGLNQMFSMVNGTIPIVSNVGGLKSTVSSENGILIPINQDFNNNQFQTQKALERAIELFKNKKKLTKMRRDGMQKDFSWNNASQRYKTIFSLLHLKAPEMATKRKLNIPAGSVLRVEDFNSLLGDPCKTFFAK